MDGHGKKSQGGGERCAFRASATLQNQGSHGLGPERLNRRRYLSRTPQRFSESGRLAGLPRGHGRDRRRAPDALQARGSRSQARAARQGNRARGGRDRQMPRQARKRLVRPSPAGEGGRAGARAPGGLLGGAREAQTSARKARRENLI